MVQGGQWGAVLKRGQAEVVSTLLGVLALEGRRLSREAQPAQRLAEGRGAGGGAGVQVEACRWVVQA